MSNYRLRVSLLVITGFCYVGRVHEAGQYMWHIFQEPRYLERLCRDTSVSFLNNAGLSSNCESSLEQRAFPASVSFGVRIHAFFYYYRYLRRLTLEVNTFGIRSAQSVSQIVMFSFLVKGLSAQIWICWKGLRESESRLSKSIVCKYCFTLCIVVISFAVFETARMRRYFTFSVVLSTCTVFPF